MTPPTLPTIHLNGTSGEALIRQCADACCAIRETLIEVRQAAPHMRDYYVLADAKAVFSRACAEHQARLAVLEHVADEFEAMALALMEKMDTRRSLAGSPPPNQASCPQKE